MKRSNKALLLTRSTLRRLDTDMLRRVHGARDSAVPCGGDSVCPPPPDKTSPDATCRPVDTETCSADTRC